MEYHQKKFQISVIVLLYSLKSRKNTESENRKVLRTKKGKIMFWSKCAACDSEKLKFIKEQEASRLLSSLVMKTPLSEIPLVGPILLKEDQIIVYLVLKS